MTEKIKRYSEPLKKQVVQEYEGGERIENLRKKYGIEGTSTVQRWVKKYGLQAFRHEMVRIQTAEEANQVRKLEKQVKDLQQALGKVMLEKLKLESILEELGETYGDRVKKNAPSSSNGFCLKSSEELSSK
jgi:transposase